MVQELKTQKILEKQLDAFAEQQIPAGKTMLEIFGPLENWMLNLGGHALLLNPLEKTWYYYDTLHKTWERTGFAPGVVEFTAVGNRLGVKILKPPATSSTPENTGTLMRPLFRFALKVSAPEFAQPVPVIGSMIIGRGKDSDILLNDRLSSRSHARISWDGETLTVEDLNTTNGTKVNGEKIQQPTPLQEGDYILIGKIVLRVIAAQQGES